MFVFKEEEKKKKSSYSSMISRHIGPLPMFVFEEEVERKALFPLKKNMVISLHDYEN